MYADESGCAVYAVYGCGQMYAKMLGMWASIHGCVHDDANWCERICAMGVWVCGYVQMNFLCFLFDMLGFLVFRYI